jgi:single-strand DNA-binding protein
MAFNRIVLQGRLSSNPETRETSSGITVTNFTLAVDRGFGEDKKTDFIPCVIFGKQAETIGKFVTKGTLILISGTLQTKSWEDKEGNKRTGFEVLAQEFAFCESKSSSSTNSPSESKKAVQGDISALNEVSNNEDLPF